MDIKPVSEGESFRDAASEGYGTVTWSTPITSGEEVEAVRATQDAVNKSASSLAAVDYVRLSLPDFITPTRSLQLNEQYFRQGTTRAESYGEGAGGERFMLVLWQGAEIPQLPERPLVHRWVRVYALYDLGKRQVVRLVPTIGGEVLE